MCSDWARSLPKGRRSCSREIYTSRQKAGLVSSFDCSIQGPELKRIHQHGVAMPLQGAEDHNDKGIHDQDGWDALLWQSRHQYRRPLFDGLKALVKWKPNMTILDLGCGTGDFTCEVHRQANAVTTLGVDKSMNMLAL